MQDNEILIRIRYGETDQMGVVHHGNYALYLEMGRTEWLRSSGISYSQMEKDGVMLPVISMSLNFKKSAHYDEVIRVKTKLTKTPSVKIEFDYEITNQAGELLVEANTVLAFINMQTKRPMRCPDYILEKLEK
ncbi:thioesterase family protein [Oceanihabitans sediminis]|uniref:Acyl-CoA thioesterase n=1 Tax=Oceanihabitans sediminis TaxID=1812012 RepID=A0A368P7J7_9FLAO|nr:thioesterase family protein [Oceanihabitans sediminis]MDX1277763.1 thioesterase family protein [Oceanihabitans sediminis]MDX1774811.1 thioesterase family protein [Oceanihabitans sediminis]RBP32688.1 acyl-CoA thioester hydrolase [Oceanihabitans sediminis]RCU57769.1 acyl-CoA thioesterase [Oceanihabitans sediminis]